MFSTSFYEQNYYAISCVVAGALMTASFMCTLSQFFQIWSTDMSSTVPFSFLIIVILLLYTVLPLHFHVTVILACGFSIVSETMLSVADPERVYKLNHVVVNVLLHLCLHAIGIHIKIIIEVISLSSLCQLMHH